MGAALQVCDALAAVSDKHGPVAGRLTEQNCLTLSLGHFSGGNKTSLATATRLPFQPFPLGAFAHPDQSPARWSTRRGMARLRPAWFR